MGSNHDYYKPFGMCNLQILKRRRLPKRTRNTHIGTAPVQSRFAELLDDSEEAYPSRHGIGSTDLKRGRRLRDTHPCRGVLRELCIWCQWQSWDCTSPLRPGTDVIRIRQVRSHATATISAARTETKVISQAGDHRGLWTLKPPHLTSGLSVLLCRFLIGVLVRGLKQRP